MSKKRPKVKKARVVRVPRESTDLVLAAEAPASDLVPYLDIETPPVILALTPPDLARCQCEWLDQTQATFGPRPVVRCQHPPTVVAFQKRSRDEEPTGAMSLCADHRVMLSHMFPGQLYYRLLTHDGKYGDVVE